MNITFNEATADLKLTDNLTVPPDTSTIYGKLCWLTVLEN